MRVTDDSATDEEIEAAETEGVDDEDDTSSVFPWVPGGGAFGWVPGGGSDQDDDPGRGETVEDDPAVGYEEQATATDESWWDEALIGALLVAGVLLFVFPEPATSGLGILLIGLGVLAWIVDAVTA